jgi:hypothetical protein
VSTGRGNFQGAPGDLLPAHIGQVRRTHRGRPRWQRCDCRRPLSVQDFQQIVEVADRHNVAPAHHRGLGRIVPRHEQPLHRPRPRVGGHGQHPLDRSHAAVKGQLADKKGIVEAFGWQKSGTGKNAHGNGHIKGSAVLAQIGRGQIHCDSPQGEFEPAIFQCAPDAHAALAHASVREAHNVAAG